MAFRAANKLRCALRHAVTSQGRCMGSGLTRSKMAIPAGLSRRNLHNTWTSSGEIRFTQSHEWVEMIKDNTARIGITDYAQNALGDIVYVELPEIGDEVEVDDEFGAVESVKACSELYAPVEGTVCEINEVLSDKPGLLNSDAEGEGWIVSLTLTGGDGEFNSLLSKDEYEKLIAGDED